MSFENCILAIDQGTTSTRAIIFSDMGKIICSAQQEFTQHYPDDGWVEHDPEEIWSSTIEVCKEALNLGKSHGADVVTYCGGASILPDNGIIDGRSGGFVPNQSRFPLIGDADSDYVCTMRFT